MDERPTIHPLIAEFARLQDQDAEKSALPDLATATGNLASQANKSGLPEQMKPLREHLESVSRAAEAVSLETAALLLNELGYHLRTVAEYEGARKNIEQALKIDEKVYGPDHPDVATDVDNLGRVLQDLGDL